MSKQRAGLPVGFDLGVTEAEVTAPVQIEDYLDREFAKPLPKPQTPRPQPTIPKVVDLARKERTERKQEPPKKEPEERPRARIQPLRRPPRKELSLDAETERKAAEVVSDIQEQGPQSDATSSEFVRAIVQLAYDARHKADYSRLNRRGQWGSPTAKAFVADLKDAFLRAIGQHYLDRYPHETRDQFAEPLEEPSESR